MEDKAPLDRFSLNFHNEWAFLEASFRRDMTRAHLPRVRKAVLLTLILYCLFAILDYYVAYDNLRIFYTIRFAIILPFALLFLFLTFTPFYEKLSQPLIFLLCTSGALGIILMIAHTPNGSNDSYYTGLILVFLSIQALYRLGFIWAFLSYLMTIVAFELVILNTNTTTTGLLLQHNFYVLTSALLCIISSYVNERAARLGYLENHLFLKEQEKVKDHKHKMETLGILSGGIAHDLNNSLSAITGYSELSLQEIMEDTPAHTYQREILNITKNASAMARQVLSFGRKQQLKVECITLSPIIKEALTLIKPNLPYNISLKSEIGEESQIEADSTQIHRIVVNLCTNAVQALSKSGNKGSIHVKLNKRKDFMELVVADDGPGIPPEYLDRIFTTYFSTKKSAMGTGLGLSLVKEIVEHFGGEISVESQLNKGTVFTITLPITDKKDPLSKTP